ncbi:hypothetical protein RKD31_004397 [Streptomyces sp. SAI-163]
MQRLYDFLRRHPTGVDSFWALVVLGISLVTLVTPGTRVDGTDSVALIVPFTVLLSLVIALRQRAPERMLLLAVALGVGQLVFDVSTLPADFAFLVIIYTVAATGARWASRTALVTGLCAAPLSQLRWADSQLGMGASIAVTVFQAVPFALAWVLGDSVRTRRAYFAQLEERATRLEKGARGTGQGRGRRRARPDRP